MDVKEMHSATKNKTEILKDAFNLKNIARKQTQMNECMYVLRMF